MMAMTRQADPSPAVPDVISSYGDDNARWQAVLDRDAAAAGAFWLGVITTGIYCRPGCPARAPKRENVRFFDTPDAARAAGFRACKRCDPDHTTRADPLSAGVTVAARLIETAETPPPLATLAAQAGLSPSHFSRAFKARLGVTPAQYAHGVRDHKLKSALADGSPVTGAVYEAGFGAPSRAYEAAGKRLGMTPGRAAKKGRGETIRYSFGESFLGRVLVAATERGLCAVQLGDDDDALLEALRLRFAAATLEAAQPGSAYAEWIAAALAAIDHPEKAAGLPLDIQGTAFQEQVWRALMAIPAGQTRTYSQLAEDIGRPTATRAVAAACGANRLAVIIPCHRVIGKDGTLTGYRWGTQRKEKLLARERS